ncbi:unnamed protein product, partial [Mesorhabditis belari]|uniref:Uncharacterized protein n=1 Tax=Mesorhabditis belari TaxID=2138241 RepID=A0AAF3FS08_9BILA
MKIFYRFSGIFIVLLVVLVLEGIYVGLQLAENSLKWSNETEKADIDVDLMETLEALLLLASYMQNIVNLFISPLVVYFVFINDELMLPIRYSLKWPLLQAILPSFLCVIAAEIYLLFPGSLILNELFDWIHAIPMFLMIAFDVVTRRKVKELKVHNKVSYAESLLMLQMLTNSFLMLITKIVFPSIGILVKSSFGSNTLSVFDSLLELNRYFFFYTIMGIISIWCFRRIDDDRRDTLEMITGKSAALSFEALKKRRQTI